MSSRYIERASPITSKPGPMLAEEQGTSGDGLASWRVVDGVGGGRLTDDVHLDGLPRGVVWYKACRVVWSSLASFFSWDGLLVCPHF